ncbi:hypothetical protein ACP275_12G032700 [Erythranthe tilingii]
MNMTILEKLRCMLLSSGCSKKFWGEAATTTYYLINRSPSSALKFKTPQEIWTSQPPTYNHLRIFGCAAYAHIRQDKLKARALKLWKRKCYLSRRITLGYW